MAALAGVDSKAIPLCRVPRFRGALHDESLKQIFEVKSSEEGRTELVTSLNEEMPVGKTLLKLTSPAGYAKEEASKEISPAGCAGEAAATTGAGKVSLVLPLDSSVHVNILLPPAQ